MKSYTDLEQSKKLAEFLPIESADMWYHGYNSPWKSERKYDDRPCPFHSVSPSWDKPCWSLTALLSVIPKPDLVQNSEGTWLLHSWVNDYPWSVGGYSNPVDACVAMIEKLHEQNIL